MSKGLRAVIQISSGTSGCSNGFSLKRPNGLGFSGGALIDREDHRTDPSFQNRPDLIGATRRPLQARVGRQLERTLHHNHIKRRSGSVNNLLLCTCCVNYLTQTFLVSRELVFCWYQAGFHCFPVYARRYQDQRYPLVNEWEQYKLDRSATPFDRVVDQN